MESLDFIWIERVQTTIFLAVLAVCLMVLGVILYRRQRRARMRSPFSLEPVSPTDTHLGGARHTSAHQLIGDGQIDPNYHIDFSAIPMEYASLSLLKRWALDSRAKKEYWSARGYQHLTALKRAKRPLQREIAFHQKESRSLESQLVALELEERKAIQAAAEAFVLDNRFSGIRGIGPAVTEDIFTQLQPRVLTDLHRAGTVRGVGPARQEAINAWVRHQQEYLASHPEMPFPGRKELTAPFSVKRQDLVDRREEHDSAVMHKTAVLEQITKAVDDLKGTRTQDYVRAGKGKPEAAAKVEVFEQGVFDTLQPAPEWYQEVVGDSDTPAPPLHATKHVAARVVPLGLRFHVDIDEEGRRVLEVRCSSTGSSLGEHSVSFDDIARYDYVETSRDGRTLYKVGSQDRQVLLALGRYSVGKDVQGRMIIDSSPDVLAKLRQQASTVESERSARIRVTDTPTLPALAIDYAPGQGLSLRTGYGDSLESITPVTGTASAGGSMYARTIDGFVRLVAPTSAAGQKLLADGSATISPERIPDFFTGDLPHLRKEFRTFFSANAFRIQVTEANSKPVVKVDIGIPGWLNLQVSHEAGGAAWPHTPFAATPHSSDYRQVDEYTWLKTPRVATQIDQALQEFDAQPFAGGYRIPMARFASLDDFVAAIDARADLGDSYQAFLKDLTDFDADPTYRLVDALERDLQKQALHLRPYQRAGIHWLDWLNTYYLHGLLADDMGLGKTLQALCAMRQAYTKTGATKHSLIVAPKSVMVHWQRELGRVFPEMPVYLHHGNERRQSRRLLHHSDRPAIFVTTYATAANDVELLAEVPFYFLLLDEATNVKNPFTKRAQSIKLLNADHRMALSGTPVENRPSELWSVFDFLMAGHLGRYGTFQRLFETPILNGDKHASERLGRRVGPFMLRRQKHEVAKDLPEKIELDEWCELTDEQRTLYKSFQDETAEIRQALSGGEQVSYAGVILPLLTKLKQVCDHPALIAGNPAALWGRSEKFDLIFEKVRTIREKQEQVVIFSHFLGMLDLFERACQQEDLSYIRIDGSTVDRQARIDHFNGHHASIALCSLMAAGYGINLTAANHVIHADRWWNPAIEAQATDRVHRIGQDKGVFVYRILVQGTLEEWIDSLLTTKRKMAEQIVGAAGERQLHWTREELIEILRPVE